MSVEATPLATVIPFTVTVAEGSSEVGINFIFEVEKGTATVYVFCEGRKVGVNEASGVKLKNSKVAFVEGLCL
jgi:hypothetical protein